MGWKKKKKKNRKCEELPGIMRSSTPERKRRKVSAGIGSPTALIDIEAEALKEHLMETFDLPTLLKLRAVKSACDGSPLPSTPPQRRFLTTSSIFPEFHGFALYNELLKRKICSLGKKMCTQLVKRHFRSTDPLEDQPKFLTDIASWAVEKIFSLDWSKTKRKIEAMNAQSAPDYWNFELSKDLIILVFSFMRKDKNFLDSVGLVSFGFYHAAIQSWEQVRITKRTVWKIPVLAMRSARRVAFYIDKNVLMEEIDHVLRNIRGAESVHLDGASDKFMRRLDVADPIGCRWLTLNAPRMMCSRTAKRTEVALFCNNTRLERMSCLRIPAMDLPIVDQYQFHRLTEIAVRPNKLIPNGCSLPPFFADLGKLCTLRVASRMDRKSWETVGRMLFLSSLSVRVCTEWDVTALRAHVYTKLENLQALRIEVNMLRRSAQPARGARHNLFGGIERMVNLRDLSACFVGPDSIESMNVPDGLKSLNKCETMNSILIVLFQPASLKWMAIAEKFVNLPSNFRHAKVLKLKTVPIK